MLNLDESDDEQIGRTLNESEYIQALKKRDDIFRIKNETALRIILLVTFAIGVIFTIWLSTMRPIIAASDFYRDFLKEYTVNLARGKDASAVRQYNSPSPGGNVRSVNFIKSVQKPASYVHKTKFTIHKLPAAVRNTTRQKTGLPIQAETNPIETDSAIVSHGDNFKKRGNDDDAFAAYKQALIQNPRNVRALSGTGDLFLKTGNLDSAGGYYKAALTENPHNAIVHNSLGTVRYFFSTLASNPAYSQVRKISDPALFSKSQYDSAIAEYSQAIALDSACVSALTNRGVLRDIRKDFEGAIRDYARAIEINPSYADAYSKRASTYKTLGKYQDAVNDYTAAIKLDSSSYEFNPTLRFANAFFGRGATYFRMREFDKAISDFDSALILSPRHALVIISRAAALSEKKMYDSAVAGFTRGIAMLAPTEYDGAQKLAYLHRGDAFKASGNYDRAIADYKSAMESRKLAAKSCWRIAECYSLNKNIDSAVGWLKKSISYGFTDFNKWKRDEDLAPLRETREFHDITGI